jgi:hypothetical protein
MIRLQCNRWRGQFEHPDIILTIRRKIRGSVVAYRTVLVDLEGTDITGPQAAEIMAGWSATTVKGCGCVHTLPYPLPNVMLANPQPRDDRP